MIPARGGSKGIPRKNIRMVAGKPLIVWTIEHALQSKYLDYVVVSTDEEEISEVARKAGATVLRRPPELATDDSLVIHTIQHAIKYYPCDWVVLLQPTSPIRRPGLVDMCIEEAVYNDVDTVATGFYCKYQPYSPNATKRRQDVKGFFVDDGNVYVIKRSLIEQGKIKSENYKPVITSREENVEVDDEFDLWLVEQILRWRWGESSR